MTANVVTDASGARLALFSQATGTPGALSIVNNTTALNFQVPSGGVNASLSVDGVPISSASNTITGVIPGVTLNLLGAAPGSTVQLTVGPDTAQTTQAIQSFVTAYNQIVGDLNKEYAVDPTTHLEGPLAGDPSVRALQSSLLGDATYSMAGNGGYVNLTSLGISMNNDGTLTLNSSQLSSALSANPTAVQNFFQNASVSGFANNFHSDLLHLTDVTDGLLNVDLAQNKAQQTSLSDSMTNFQNQLAAQQTQLTLQFSQVNASLQAYPLLLQQVTETLAALGGGTAGSTSSHPVLTSGL